MGIWNSQRIKRGRKAKTYLLFNNILRQVENIKNIYIKKGRKLSLQVYLEFNNILREVGNLNKN